jgi:hypothetical protein
MIRENVFELINGERNYQDSQLGRKAVLSDEQLEISDGKAPVAAWIIFMEKHLIQAKQAIYDLSESGALEEVRKITALGVACMEHNDTLPRGGVRYKGG